MRLPIFLAAVVLLLPIHQVSAGPDYERVLRERLAPPGSGGSTTPVVLANGEPAPISGEAIYNQGCAACHNGGVGGAPRKGATHIWELRLQTSTEQALKDAAWNGKGAMPAKGLCPTCSREEIDAAVVYLLSD